MPCAPAPIPATREFVSVNPANGPSRGQIYATVFDYRRFLVFEFSVYRCNYSPVLLRCLLVLREYTPRCLSLLRTFSTLRDAAQLQNVLERPVDW